MRHRFAATFPASMLSGMVVYYGLVLVFRGIAWRSGEGVVEPVDLLLYGGILLAVAVVLMGVAAASMTILAGRERRMWFALWPFLIYAGMVLALSADIRGFSRDAVTLGSLILIPGFVGSIIPALWYQHHPRPADEDAS